MNKSKSMKRCREMTQSNRYGVRRANDGIGFEKNRAHRVTRRKVKRELRDFDDGHHQVVERINVCNIY